MTDTDALIKRQEYRIELLEEATKGLLGILRGIIEFAPATEKATLVGIIHAYPVDTQRNQG